MEIETGLIPGRLEGLFASFRGHLPLAVKALTGAGSNRKYYRLSDGGFSAVGVAGTDAGENGAFLYLAEHFLKNGVNVPEIYAVSEDRSCYLQEDLGDLSLYDAVAAGRERGEYNAQEQKLLLDTVSMLPEIQFGGMKGLDFSRCYPEPSFSRSTVMSDLNYFKFCFLKATGLEYNEVLLDRDFNAMADEFSGDCPGNVFMYRDFQARNVMLKDGEPYFIDFQGGRRGPMHYDLASFIWQAKARYPEALKEKMAETYMDAVEDKYMAVDRPAFRKRLGLYALLRTLQVLGAYGFRGYFERKPHFLASIPSAIANLRGMLPLSDYPELDGVLRELVGMPRFAMDGPEKSGEPGKTLPEGEANGRLTVEVYSFSYKRGIPEDGSGNGGGYVFDCRSIHNPGRYEQYRTLTGKDREVAGFLEADGEVFGFLEHVYGIVDPHVETFIKRGFTHLMVSFGCTGGQHRSVYCAESMARHLRGKYDVDVMLTHREQAGWPSRTI